MKPLLLLLSTILSYSSFCQVYTSNCNATTDMVKVYRNDAYRVATERVKQLGVNWKDSVEIPETYIDTIAKAFYAIENMAWTRVKDTVRYIYGYNNFSNPSQSNNDSSHYMSVMGFNAISIKRVRVLVPNTASWYNDWMNGNFNNTSNTQLNDLMNRFGLTAQLYSSFSTNRYYDVISSKAINVHALRLAFSQITGVSSSDLYSYIGDGSNVLINYLPDGLKLTYRHGCGDCPAGCTFGRQWEFKYYYNNCSVEYVTSTNWGFNGDIYGGGSYTCIGQVMPLSLIDFRASVVDRTVRLSWEVTDGSKISSFEIEKSVDGRNFTSVGNVHSVNTLKNYSFTDKAPFYNNHYRIKQVDQDGKFFYSKILFVKVENANAISIRENPVKDVLKVNINSEQGQVKSLAVYDLYGRKIKTFSAKQGSQQLDVSAIASGKYYLQLITIVGEVYYQAFVK